MALSTEEVLAGLAELINDETGIATFASLTDGRQRKAKTIANAGNLALTVGRDPTDPGQVALAAAAKSKARYAFRITIPDRVTADGDDSVIYFRGLVTSNRNNVGNAENVVRKAYSVEIDSELVEVQPN